MRQLRERTAADAAPTLVQHAGKRERYAARTRELLARVAACKAVLEKTDAETARTLFLTLGYPRGGFARIAGLPDRGDLGTAFATVGSRSKQP